MRAIYEITDENGDVINRIVATDEYVKAVHPGRYSFIEAIIDEVQPPAPTLSAPILYAAAQLRILNGDITGIGVNSRFAGAFWIDVGKYCVFFVEAQPDTSYIALADGGLCRAYVLDADKGEDFFTITVTDQAGTALDAETVNISIMRAG